MTYSLKRDEEKEKNLQYVLTISSMLFFKIHNDTINLNQVRLEIFFHLQLKLYQIYLNKKETSTKMDTPLMNSDILKETSA